MKNYKHMIVQNLADVTIGSLLSVWSGVLSFIPSLIGALIVLIIGLIVAVGLSSIVEKIIAAIKLDAFLHRLGLEEYFNRAGLKINAKKFFGALVYWFFIIVFVLAAADAIGLTGLSQFLRDVVAYIPQIVVAVLILLVSVVIANALRTTVKASVVGSKLHAANFLSNITWWSAVIFGFITALIQLGIAPMLLNTIITGLVAMIALAGGIAFGLGGKDYALHLIAKFRERVE